MAEVIVGVVASGISIGTLAAQITSSIIRLKSYWDQVQDAPDDMRDLIEELEDLNQLLVDIEEDQRQNPISNLILDPSSSSRCLQHCKQGATRLKELTDSLSEDIEGNSKLKRKWASVKLVLKKDKIDRYRMKLQRVISLLNLSHQIYTRSVSYSFEYYHSLFRNPSSVKLQCRIRTKHLRKWKTLNKWHGPPKELSMSIH